MQPALARTTVIAIHGIATAFWPKGPHFATEDDLQDEGHEMRAMKWVAAAPSGSELAGCLALDCLGNV